MLRVASFKTTTLFIGPFVIYILLFDAVKLYGFNPTSFDNFKTFVSQYPVLQNNKNIRFSERKIEGSLGYLKGSLEGSDGSTVQIEYQLIKENNEWKILSIIPVIILIVLFWKTRLHTKIGPSGIETRFEPFGIFKRSFNWNDISSCYIRQYAPLREYGGWGVRGLNKAKAYNVSGNMGIQIITKNNEKFLIGTNKPAKAEKAIQRYHKKINQ